MRPPVRPSADRSPSSSPIRAEDPARRRPRSCSPAPSATPAAAVCSSWRTTSCAAPCISALDAQGKDRTIRDLLGAQNYRGPSGEVVRIGELSAYVRHQVAGQFDVMVSETKRDRALTREEFESVHDLGSRFYSVIIVDTANDESAENWRAAVQRADALVVPLKWRNDYSLPAIEMLEELQGIR